ncbi:class III extradiol ring-cleavage dioxygenase [uncultured Kiloniella sp.]|uniref:DODA-type extradiol aromatic ring-opening family dioxygenase n=1 Tax=uncultured Kiloniella sp. TaxID=1133091 RepID=UPI002616E149|nr:class III extradiol ring-cleavage dioxygenase [uncultured Kiloniella sp.]
MSIHSSQPSLFLPHGAPDLPLSTHPATTFLKGLASHLKRPDAILIISAHWETKGLHITTGETLETIHDFAGFSSELYHLKYPAKSSPALIKLLREHLKNAGYEPNENKQRGLDHGAWIPLLLAFPEADIPVVQLSLDRRLSTNDLYQLGLDLSTIRNHNILIIGSGAITHNLRALAPEHTPPPDWAVEFSDWVQNTLHNSEWTALCNYMTATSNGRVAHPTPEHFLPLLIAAGSGGENTVAHRLHNSFSYGSISMDAWMFNAP